MSKGDRTRVDEVNAAAAAAAAGAREVPRSVDAMVILLSPPRALQSLLGGLLDGHPDVAVAHEAGALRLAADGGTRATVIRHLCENARLFAERRPGFPPGRPRLSHQGPPAAPVVVGDCASGAALRLLRENPTILVEFGRFLTGLRLHVVVPMLRPERYVVLLMGGRRLTFEAALERIRGWYATIDLLRRTLPADAVRVVDMEGLLADPEPPLRGLCAFLDLDAPPDWVAECATMAQSARLPPVKLHVAERRAALAEALRPYPFVRPSPA